MTISMDGKYQTRDGSKAVRILCVDRPDSLYPVVALLDGNPETFTASGRFTVTSESRLDLLPIPQPPRLVPLAAKDVIAGKTILKAPWFSEGGGGTAISSVHPVRVAFLGAVTTGDDSEYRTYRKTWLELMREGWTYSNDHGTTWQPCSKPEGAVS